MICISRCLFIKVTICMTLQNMFFLLITKWCIKPRNGSWNHKKTHDVNITLLCIIYLRSVYTRPKRDPTYQRSYQPDHIGWPNIVHQMTSTFKCVTRNLTQIVDINTPTLPHYKYLMNVNPDRIITYLLGWNYFKNICSFITNANIEMSTYIMHFQWHFCCHRSRHNVIHSHLSPFVETIWN